MRALAFALVLAPLLAGCTAASYGAVPEDAPRSGKTSKTGDAEGKDDAEDRAPPATTTSGSQTTIDLGDVAPSAEGAFDVPEGTLGFNVSVLGDAAARVGVASLIAPDGTRVVTDYALAGSRAKIALGNRGASAVSYPQTSATAQKPVPAGRWRVVVGGVVVPPNATPDKSNTSMPAGAAVESPLRVVVRVQRASTGAFQGGELDTHVYVPRGMRIHDPDPLHEVVAEKLATDASLARRVDAFYDELQRLFGIGRGAVTFHAIDGSFRSATTGDARAALIAQATAEAPQALHVVFTNEMSYGGGAPLLGYSVGLPGIANAAGTVRSAISVALYPDQTATNDAVTMVHEMGHFVGLLHTLDDDGSVDPLDDTATCDTRTKTCAAADNLMAPDGPLRTANVSPTQVRIVRGSPIYRAR